MSIAQRIHALLEPTSAHPSTLATELAVSRNGRWYAICPAALMTQKCRPEAKPCWRTGQLGSGDHHRRSDGSIFEVKAPFPKGQERTRLLQPDGRDGELHGHLKLDNVAGIALVSKLFMGREGTPSSSSATVAAAFQDSTWAGTSSASCCLSRWSVSWPCAFSIKEVKA